MVTTAATESERRTRRERIDPRVRRAGWSVIVPFQPPLDSSRLTATAVEEFETANGPADYALCSGGSILGVVEAKKLAVGPKGVLGQAGRYSEGIQQEPRYEGRYGVPFLYSTNGETIRFHDCRDPLNLSRDVAHFHSPAALLERLGRDYGAELRRLDTIPTNGKLRQYQHDANAAVERALAERRRRMLLPSAYVGTGQPNVNGTRLSALRAPLSSLAEQQQIAQQVNGLFSLVESVGRAIASALHAMVGLASAVTAGRSTDSAQT